MTRSLYITLDLHAHRWLEPDADDAAIWLCLQPHVKLADNEDVKIRFGDLRYFVENCANGSRFDYRLVDEEQAKTADFVPVNLPSDVDVTIRWDADGPMRAANPNQRSNDMKILYAPQFDSDNREKLADDTVGSDLAQLVDEEPFALAYNQALTGALDAIDRDNDLDLSDLADQLILGFWGGTRRRIRGTTVECETIEFMSLQTNDPQDASELEADPTFRTTNLHSLNGLMFKVLDKAEITELNEVRDLTIELSWAHGRASLVVSAQPEQGLKRMKAFFNSLPKVSGDILKELTHQNEAGIAERVYVDDQMVGFGTTKLTTRVDGQSETWFRRRAERRANPEQAFTLADLSRMVVHFGRPENAEDDQNLPPELGTLTFDVADIIEGRLTRYRLGGAIQESAWIVAKFSPSETDKAQYERECAGDRNCFNDKVLLKEGGTPFRADELRFLGSYVLPWEEDPLVPLFIVKSEDGADGEAGILGSRENVSVFIPRRDDQGNPVQVKLDPAGSRTKQEAMIDATSPRWELRRGSVLPDIEFEALRLTDPDEEIDLSRIVLTAAFREDAEFVFANGVSRYEGVIRVNFPGLKGDQAEQDIREDLINFNTLNLYHRWPAFDEADAEDGETLPPQMNTRYSELFPFWSQGDGRHTSAVAFQYLFKQPVQSQPGDLTGEHVRRYFEALYKAAGSERILDFRLEHSYGSELDLAQDVGVDTPLDIRPMLPSHVGSPPARELSRVPPFFSVSFESSDATETIRLVFERSYLNPSKAPRIDGDKGRQVLAERDAYVNALRSLCELAFAKRLELEGQFFAFDFNRALKSEGVAPLIAGLTPVDSFEGNGWPLWLNDPAQPERNLQLLAKNLLQNWKTAPTSIQIELPVGNHPRISDVCNVIEFSLRLSRDPSKVPVDNPDHWTVVRQVIHPNTLDWTGPTTEVAAGVGDGFKAFLSELREARAAIQPDDKTRELSGRLYGLLSEGEATSTNAWIVPQGLKRLDEAEVMASVTPMSFVPIQEHDQLGPQTFELVKRYLNGLQNVLSLATGKWIPKGTDNEIESAWKTLFARIEKNRQYISTLAERLTSLILPTHLDVRDDSKLDPEVLRSIRELTGGGRVQEKVYEEINRRLLNDVALFGNAKAMLYTRLSDSSGKAGVNHAFYEWESVRTSARGTLRDQRNLNYREGVAALAGEPSYGFLETLLDEGYGNSFVLKWAQARSFESLIEPFERNSTSGLTRDVVIPLAGRRPRIPDPYTPHRTVYLPSRHPIKDPILASAESFESIQKNEDWAQTYRNGTQGMDIGALLAGKIKIAAGDSAVYVRAPSMRILDRSKQLDDFLVTAVFQVWSDEEDSFSNDEFIFQVSFVEDGFDSRPLISKKSVRLSESFLKQLFTLSESPQISGIETLTDLIEHVEESTDLFIPCSKRTLIDDENVTQLRLEVANDGGESLRQVKGTPAADWFYEAYLLCFQSDADDARRPRPHYLLFATERSLWQRTSIQLLQSRNRRDLVGPDFAPIFGYLSQSVTSTVAQQYSKAESLQKTLRLSSRKMAWSAIERQLVAQQFLRESEKRLSHSVVVSIYHVQRGRIQQGYFGSQKTPYQEEMFEFISDEVLDVVTVRPDAQDTIIRFSRPYDAFAIDLQWYSHNNRELLRIVKIPVSIYNA